jgi:TolB-like protein
VPQVFVSYSRTDKREVSRLVSALRKFGFQPWWDDDIPAGASWEATIERALTEAAAVIVCWSPASVASENVRSEARVAKSRGRLVQIFIDKCEPPLFFGELQGIDLTNWNGSARNPQSERLKQALNAVLSNAHANETASTAARQPQRWSPPRWSIVAGIAIVAAALGTWLWMDGSPARASRVVVLPIKGLGGSPALQSVADGLADQINASLVDGHIPTVIDNLTGTESDEKLKSFDVAYTVSGTLERSGDTLHARLHVDDRLRHSSLWSYETTGPATEQSMLNSAVARSIAGVISCAYRALGANGLKDTELLSRYLRACDLFVNHDDAQDFKSTFELFDDLRVVIAKAPRFAPAQSDFAKFGAYLAPLLPPDQASAIRIEAAKAATRALELDPRSSDAYVAREMLLAPTEWAKREALLRKAVSVDPRWPHSNGFLGMLLTETGRMREAAVYGQRAAAADLQIDWKPFGARMACAAGHTDGAISELRQYLDNSPADSDAKWALRWCLLEAGKVRESQKMDPPQDNPSLAKLRTVAQNVLASDSRVDRERAREIGAKLPTDQSIARFVVPWSAAAGDLDTAFRFAATLSPGYPTTGIIDFIFSPETASMRQDPRFFALMKRYGLIQFWQSTGRWPDFCAGPRLAKCKASAAVAMARP